MCASISFTHNNRSGSAHLLAAEGRKAVQARLGAQVVRHVAKLVKQGDHLQVVAF